MKVEIRYPILCFNSIKIEMTEDEFEAVKSMPLEDQAKWIVEKDNKLDSPSGLDDVQICHALDVDYATIRAIRQ